jgi:P pilus assembly chaperone PapD
MKMLGMIALAAAAVATPLSTAHAELVLSQLVVELAPGGAERADVEAWNNGRERIFVAIEPREIVDPGKGSESGLMDPDPDKLGLLVSPARMILEPGQRKLLRIASIATGDRERVYRVTVKPVVGQLSSEASGLKVLVGYDLLVLARPGAPKPHVSGTRSGDQLTLRNDGNVSVELVDGKECDPSLKICEDIAGGRLYVGAEKTLKVSASRKVDFKLKVGSKLLPAVF